MLVSFAAWESFPQTPHSSALSLDLSPNAIVLNDLSGQENETS